MPIDPVHQLALRQRPPGRAIMRQSWRDLLFLHFPCDPAEVERLVPRGLTVDTFPDDRGVQKAWIGLVPFLMKDVRWSFAPRIPGTHTFPETNVRTYVHRNGQEPGVWFFSLDAMNRLAVGAARAAFALPYYHARMSLDRRGDHVHYRGDRLDADYEIDAVLGESLFPPQPGSLEFFLVERYRLYSARGDRLWTGRVFHPPYVICQATIQHCDENLVTATKLGSKPFVHAMFSEGVDVEVFPLRRIV